MPSLSTSDLTLLAALFIGVAWYLLMRRRAQAEPMTRQRLQELRQQGAVVLDVRSPGEFAAGHAPGARNIPLGDLKARLGELDRTRPVLACCASGMRSGSACAILRRAGFTEVHNLGPWTNL
ncbi:rhodanese-like domain-containing protein [Mesoterricola sediminis]|uniref:Sulfurtransferase n=1 Tax=Mesoterricola sediminis TaxID=2927980 RepID=A0AA48KGE2_9BACT|nr:rhodanese-like domain-containing protein [Mesoterricola sediminis]BDU77348.1 sulfurtransferase [Mesoterricola sediminis]